MSARGGGSTPLLIGLLALAAAVLAWFVLAGGDAPPGPRDDLDAGTPAVPREAPRAPASALVAPPTAEVAAAGTWDARRATTPVPITDPRIVDLEVRSETGEEWSLTGAGLLEILARELPDVPVRFRDKATLESFRARNWPVPVPNRVHLGMLLMQCADVGFLVTLRDGALYVAPFEDSAPPDEDDDR